MEFIPYILSFFSTPPAGQDGHLYYVNKERENMQTLFDEVTRDVKYRFYADKSLGADQVSDAIQANLSRYTIIHYSGHASSFELELPAEKLKADNFIEFIKICPALQVVMLNGCSTQGFVKRLLEATAVKAIIASPRPVEDETAMKFSVQFYTNLVKDTSLELSFTNALAKALKEKFTPNANVFKVDIQHENTEGIEILAEKKDGSDKRAVKKAGKAVMDNQAGTTWGLYTKSIDTLNWKLFETGDAKIARAEDMKKKTRVLQETIKKLAGDKKELVAQIDQLKAIKPAMEVIRQMINKQGKELADVRTRLEEAVKENTALKINIQDLSAEEKDEHVIAIYKEAIKRLNFSRQKNFIDEGLANDVQPKIMGFVLHGTAKCCLNQLARNLIEWIGANRIDDKVIFDFNSFLQEEELWEKVNLDFQLYTLDDPELIVKKIQNRYRDEEGNTQNNFALLFRNSSIDLFSDAAMRKKIFDFWDKFIGYFLKADSQYQQYDHRIYLFLVDDQCSLIPAPPSFISSREEDYKQAIADKHFGQASIQIIPTVEPLKQKDIAGWQSDNGIPEEYRFKPEDLTKIITETEGFLLPAIKEISSRKIKTLPRKFRAYNSFFFSIKNPL